MRDSDSFITSEALALPKSTFYSFVYLNPMLRAQTDVFIKENTVESRYNGPANNGNPLIIETILQTLGKFFSIFYIGNNRNLPVEDDNGWSLEIC